MPKTANIHGTDGRNLTEVLPDARREGDGAAAKRVAEIDAMFEAATGWGSWMVILANERESLADQFGFEHKWQARCGGKRTD